MHSWDPDRYLTFADERGRPFVELVARIGAERPRTVVDLGCGAGNLTRFLAERWPGASRATRASLLADGRAESPLETRGRLRIIASGFPVPQLQVEIHADGRLVGVYRDDGGKARPLVIIAPA